LFIASYEITNRQSVFTRYYNSWGCRWCTVVYLLPWHYWVCFPVYYNISWHKVIENTHFRLLFIW